MTLLQRSPMSASSLGSRSQMKTADLTLGRTVR
jgi:hypothetical protein